MIITKLPQLLVVVDRARALPVTLIAWRPTPQLTCRPKWSVKEEVEGKWWESRAERVVKLCRKGGEVDPMSGESHLAC